MQIVYIKPYLQPKRYGTETDFSPALYSGSLRFAGGYSD